MNKIKNFAIQSLSLNVRYKEIQLDDFTKSNILKNIQAQNSVNVKIRPEATIIEGAGQHISIQKDSASIRQNISDDFEIERDKAIQQMKTLLVEFKLEPYYFEIHYNLSFEIDGIDASNLITSSYTPIFPIETGYTFLGAWSWTGSVNDIVLDLRLSTALDKLSMELQTKKFSLDIGEMLFSKSINVENIKSSIIRKSNYLLKDIFNKIIDNICKTKVGGPIGE